MSAAVNESLRRRWDSAVSRLVASDPLARGPPATTTPALSACSARWLGRIASLHSGPARAYHNLDHIADVLAALDALRGPSLGEDGRAALDLAAFFHDAVYDPRSSTNEGDSADLFAEFAAELRAALLDSDDKGSAGDGGSDALPPTVRGIILATADHSASAASAAASGDALTCAFLDADMSVLGRDPPRYDEYAGRIRAEYSFVERGTYCARRAGVLRSFLPGEGRHIYATAEGREMWEERARANLRREIDMLERGIIPCEG